MWTRRQVLAQIGLAAAAVHTLDPHELCCVMPADAQTAGKDLFELKKVGDGVYAAIAAPRYKVNCNAAVVMTNDGVVVVDSHSKPSAARALYNEIQSMTKQPIRKIINTHFHWDHWQGNEVYANANPGVEVVASERTKENLTRPDAGVGGVPYIEKQLAAVPGEIAKLKADIQKENGPGQEGQPRVEPAAGGGVPEGASEHEAGAADAHGRDDDDLHEGGREIQLHVLGRAHTNGDLFIFLPKEKVVATGDALIDWMPS